MSEPFRCKFCGVDFSFDEDVNKCRKSPWYRSLLYGWHCWERPVQATKEAKTDE